MENFFNKDLNESYDVIILGAGPAGCSAGMYAARDALSVLILEKNFPGGNMAITEHIENYPGFTEPVLGHEITDKFVKHAQKFGAVIRQGNCVDVIDDGIWKSVILEDGRKIKCKALIIATGSKPKKTGAKNEINFIGRGISFCATCDGGFFRNKEVIVIGGGDSALEEGIYLTKFASKVTIVHRRNEFRAAKIIQNRAKENKKIQIMKMKNKKNLLKKGLKKFQMNSIFWISNVFEHFVKMKSKPKEPVKHGLIIIIRKFMIYVLNIKA